MSTTPQFEIPTDLRKVRACGEISAASNQRDRHVQPDTHADPCRTIIDCELPMSPIDRAGFPLRRPDWPKRTACLTSAVGDEAAARKGAPEGACTTWRALYAGLRKFAEELVDHIHIENNILFPRFLVSEA